MKQLTLLVVALIAAVYSFAALSTNVEKQLSQQSLRTAWHSAHSTVHLNSNNRELHMVYGGADIASVKHSDLYALTMAA